VLVRTTNQHKIQNPAQIRVIFELMMYYKQGKKVSEASIGFCQENLATLTNGNKTIQLAIQGGTPTSVINIEKEDVHTKRTGFKGIQKMFGSDIKSSLKISYKQVKSIGKEVEFHMQFLPSNCII
jgi:hypothetical protein